MQHILKVIITVTALLGSTWANATLINDDILIRFDGCCGGPTEDVVTVGTGFEISDGDGSNFEGTTAGTAVTSIDVDDSSVTFMMALSYNLDNQFFTFSDLDWVGGGYITDAILTISEIDTIVQSDITFGDDWFSIEVGLQQPANYNPDRMVRVDLVTTSASVPEPASLVLLILGLAGLGFSSRKNA